MFADFFWWFPVAGEAAPLLAIGLILAAVFAAAWVVLKMFFK
jgi:hypothetical protein